MDAQTLIQLIGSLGFPIVACVFLYISNTKESTLHKEEVSELKKTIDSNTLALNLILEHIRKDDKEG